MIKLDSLLRVIRIDKSLIRIIIIEAIIINSDILYN